MFDIHQSIYDEHGEDIDDQRVEKYIHGLMEEFAASRRQRRSSSNSAASAGRRR